MLMISIGEDMGLNFRSVCEKKPSERTDRAIQCFGRSENAISARLIDLRFQ